MTAPCASPNTSRTVLPTTSADVSFGRRPPAAVKRMSQSTIATVPWGKCSIIEPNSAPARRSAATSSASAAPMEPSSKASPAMAARSESASASACVHARGRVSITASTAR